MARGEPPSRSGLPAPYRSPWRGLLESLRAVAADLRLALQSLLRRNRQGELPRPGFWPRDLAPLFWPLLLVLALACPLAAGVWLRGLMESHAAASAPPAGKGTLTPRDATAELPEPAPMPLAAGPDRFEADSEVQLPARPRSQAVSAGAGVAVSSARRQGSAAGGRSDPHQGSSEADAASVGATTVLSGPGAADLAAADRRKAVAPSDAAPAPLRLDPLLALFSQGDDARLLLAARPDPASSRLSLTLSAAAEELSDPSLLERAERWQQQAIAAGYERLELRDGSGRLRGRSALVGSGMILLAPAPPV